MEDNYKKALLMCTGSSHHDNLQYPVKENGFYYASDGTILIRISDTVGNFEFQINKSLPPNFEAVIPYDMYDNSTIDLNTLKAFIDQNTPMEFEEFDCDECNGSGRVVCNYGHKHDCSECDGTGAYKGDMEVKSPGKLFRIDGVVFRYEILNKTITCFRLLGYDKVRWSLKRPQASNTFEVADVLFLAMPVNQTLLEEEEVESITEYIHG